jgi:predicted amidophosphoribosyltransferase
MAGWDYDPTALKRSRETRSQVGLTVAERKHNVTGAFRADKRKVDGKAILVLDDVATTGATLSACARTLKEAGAREVFAFTLGRAMPHQGLRSV